MKRLIFAIALAAVGIVPVSGAEKSAQVYEITISVKTTVAKRGKLSPAKNPFVESASESIIYRKQASQSWKGLVWGCDCESALGKWDVLGEGANATVTGAIVWNNKKPYDIILLDDMRWHVLNAIDTQGTKCECAWTIGESSDDSAAFLSFAGFGSLKLMTVKEDGALVLGDDCGSYISSVSGTVSGWMPAPTYETAGRAAICTFCGVIEEGEEGSVDTAVAWNYCPCLDVGDRDFTAVSGTWTLKYNAKLSNKLSGTDSILNVYKKFPASVKLAVSEKIAEVKSGE